MVLIQPLLRADQLLGVLVAGTAASYSAEMLDMVQRAAVQIAIAILNAVTLQRAIGLARELKFKSSRSASDTGSWSAPTSSRRGFWPPRHTS